MFSFKSYDPAKHMHDSNFHSLVSRRVQNGLDNGKPVRKSNHFDKHDIIHHKDAKVLHKHGFLKSIKPHGDSHANVTFHKHKLEELNHIISFAHNMHAVGYHHGKKAEK